MGQGDVGAGLGISNLIPKQSHLLRVRDNKTVKERKKLVIQLKYPRRQRSASSVWG